MPQISQISLNIPANELSAIQAALEVLTDTLLPHLRILNAEQRQELPKMGNKTLAFVQKSLEYARRNPELVPRFIDQTEFETDYAATETLRGMAQKMQPLCDAIADSMMLCGSEAYQAALLFYRSVRTAAAAQATPHAASIYEDLSSRFPGAPTKAKNPPADKNQPGAKNPPETRDQPGV